MQPRCIQTLFAEQLSFLGSSISTPPDNLVPHYWQQCRTDGSWRTHVAVLLADERVGQLSCLAYPCRLPRPEHATRLMKLECANTLLTSTLTPQLSAYRGMTLFGKASTGQDSSIGLPVNVLILATPSLPQPNIDGVSSFSS
ncbi:hypothetical protein IF1G_01423 [Cordyceps javanica]|uniref:Uncharacterized protein n=1 Tax=Cordyceps javanica TaxID=43265 RepID=A0A545VBY0_9HYPO|nr:hypothetical protein IF1G_01423 [Cordyceps javanica]